MSAARHYEEARRNWMIVAGLLVLAAVIDVVRDRESNHKTRKRKR